MTRQSFLTMMVFFLTSSADAFMVRPQAKVTTKLFLEDWVANMIDGELHRQSHIKDYENEWMEKNRAAVFQRMETDFGFVSETDPDEFRIKQKDKRLAEKDPQKYCADRCVATGNCDIYEEFFDLSPEEVIKFCTSCVLSEDEEQCDIPDGFYERLKP